MVNGYLEEGEYSFDLNTEGLYFCKLTFPGGTVSKLQNKVYTGKMLYIK